MARVFVMIFVRAFFLRYTMEWRHVRRHQVWKSERQQPSAGLPMGPRSDDIGQRRPSQRLPAGFTGGLYRYAAGCANGHQVQCNEGGLRSRQETAIAIGCSALAVWRRTPGWAFKK